MQSVSFGDCQPSVFQKYDAIEIADRATGETVVWAWGDRELSTRRDTPAAPRSDPTLRVEVDGNRPEQALAVLDQVEAAKGRLSDAARHYREQHQKPS